MSKRVTRTARKITEPKKKPVTNKSFVRMTRPADTSPTAKLVRGGKAKQWAKDKIDEVQKELKPKLPYYSPQHPRRAYYNSMMYLLGKLIEGEEIVLWDANRELVNKHQDFDSTGFGQACQELFD